MSDVQDTWGLGDGDLLTPDLTVTRLLGGGEPYAAYLAFDEVPSGPVVVKIARPGRVDDPSTLRGLEREVDTLTAVNHPVVVRGLRAALGGDRPHVVLEALDGPRLSSLLRRHGPLQEQQYLPLAIEMASALHYLRRVGVVHLDVKPANIIMGAPARLIDLSVARPVGEAARLTHPVGTDAYMAPEQCDPERAGGPGFAADVFGLGVTLYEAITGLRPFDDPRPQAASVTARFPQLDDVPYAMGGRVPADVAKVVEACLAPHPADRPLPHEVAEALEPALARAPRGRLAGLRTR